MLIKFTPKTILFCLLSAYYLSHSQDNRLVSDTVSLSEVTVNSTKIQNNLSNLSLSVSVLDSIDQNSFQQISLKEYLFSFPGIQSLNSYNFAQDLRISSRGFGSRSAFGIRGLKLVVDGIPETTPDGQGQIDNLNLGLIERIEVIRGPSSTLYGNSSGGVIYIESLSNFENNFINLKSTLGSYNTKNFQSTIGLNKNGIKFILHANRIESNGYRQRSELEQTNLAIKAMTSSSFGDLNFQFSYTNSPYAGDPGGLTDQERNNNPSFARSRNNEYDTYEKINHFKSSIGWNYKNQNNQWNASVFYSNRNFFGKLPFEFGGIVDLQRDYWGMNFNYSNSKKFSGFSNELLLGIEYSDQEDFRNRFKNLKGLQGENTLSQIESFSNVGLFILDQIILDNTQLNFGLRWDSNSIGTDNSPESIKLNKINPSFSIGYKISDVQNLWTSFSTSFETPTLSELSANPFGDSGLNPELNSQNALNFEFGYKVVKENSYLEFVAFYIPVKDEILPYEIESTPGRKYYRNAGKTKRRGIEVSTYNSFGKVKITNSYTYSDFKFDNYIVNSSDLKGNYIPGIPKHNFKSEFNYFFSSSLVLKFQIQYFGELYTSDNNNNIEPGYLISNFRLNLNNNLLEKRKFKINPYLGVNNVFNTDYSDNIRINAFGSRFYEPAPKRNIYLGISLKY